MVTAITIPIGKKKNWKGYAAEAGLSYLSYTLGFTLAWDIIFKHGKN